MKLLTLSKLDPHDTNWDTYTCFQMQMCPCTHVGHWESSILTLRYELMFFLGGGEGGAHAEVYPLLATKVVVVEIYSLQQVTNKLAQRSNLILLIKPPFIEVKNLP